MHFGVACLSLQMAWSKYCDNMISFLNGILALKSDVTMPAVSLQVIIARPYGYSIEPKSADS